jgi:hypothetical protein
MAQINFCNRKKIIEKIYLLKVKEVWRKIIIEVTMIKMLAKKRYIYRSRREWGNAFGK